MHRSWSPRWPPRGARLATGPPGLDLVVVDEAHHAPAAGTGPSWRVSRGLASWASRPPRTGWTGPGWARLQRAYRYGLTAMRFGMAGWPAGGAAGPARGGGPWRRWQPRRRPRAAGIGRCHGAEAALHGVAGPLLELAAGRRTVLFAVDRAHARALVEVLNRRRDGAARAIDGTTCSGERLATLAAFRAGAFPILVNVALLTEGWDEPTVDCVAIPGRPRAGPSTPDAGSGPGSRRQADPRSTLRAGGPPAAGPDALAAGATPGAPAHPSARQAAARAAPPDPAPRPAIDPFVDLRPWPPWPGRHPTATAALGAPGSTPPPLAGEAHRAVALERRRARGRALPSRRGRGAGAPPTGEAGAPSRPPRQRRPLNTAPPGTPAAPRAWAARRTSRTCLSNSRRSSVTGSSICHQDSFARSKQTGGCCGNASNLPNGSYRSATNAPSG